MNSWKSTLLSACAPPLRTFIIGTGRTRPPRRRGGATAAARRGGRVRVGERDAEDRVRAQARLVRCPVERDQRGVERGLVARVHAADRVGDLGVDVRDRFLDALAAQRCRRRAARSPRTHRSMRPTAPPRGRLPRAQDEIDLDRRVASRVEYLARLDALDLAHVSPWDGRPAGPCRGGRGSAGTPHAGQARGRRAAGAPRRRRRTGARRRRGSSCRARWGPGASGGPVEQPGGGGAALDLARVQQRGQVLRHLAEDARLAPGLAGLDLIPVGQHLARIRPPRRRRTRAGGGG